MNKLDGIKYQYLHECFRLDESTQTLYWRERPRRHFNSDRGWRIFNSKHAGKIAGSPQQGSITWDNSSFSLPGILYYLTNRKVRAKTVRYVETVKQEVVKKDSTKVERPFGVRVTFNNKYKKFTASFKHPKKGWLGCGWFDDEEEGWKVATATKNKFSLTS